MSRKNNAKTNIPHECLRLIVPSIASARLLLSRSIVTNLRFQMLIRTRHIDRPALNKSGQFIAFQLWKGGWCDLVSTSSIGRPMNCSRNPELLRLQYMEFIFINSWVSYGTVFSCSGMKLSVIAPSNSTEVHFFQRPLSCQ